jgi:hypothetical protein
MAMTPLEQAVHDLIGRITKTEVEDARSSKSGSDLGAELMQLSAPVAPVAPSAPAPQLSGTAAAHGARTHEPAAAPQLPDPPANPSHVHLVVDDGPERVVVTVAVRGNDVHVALRGNDDATTSAFARNAASLDHAMRARGLALGELTAERDPQHRPRQHDSHPPDPRERRKPDAETFTLEDKP